MPRSILLVDDQPDLVEAMSELLRLDGREVRTASSGSEAIAQMQERRASVVLIDDDLPDISSSDLAFHLKALVHTLWPKLPCFMIAIRGDLMPAELDGWPGFDHLLTKPIDFDELSRLLSQCDEEHARRLAGL